MGATEGSVEQVVVRALGVAVAIAVTDEETAQRLRLQWNRALTDEPATRTVDLAGLSQDPVAHDYTLTSRVTMAALEETAGQRINLHSGSVADEHGHVLAIVGRSGAGKTTAIHRLARDFDYLSDETVSIEDDLTVHAHPKPLSVITDPNRPGRKESIAPDDAGLGATPLTGHLRRVVLLRRGQASDENLTQLSMPAAIVEIVPQTSSLVMLEQPLVRLATMLDACGGAFALHYTEIEDEVATLAALLAAEPTSPPEWTAHPPGPTVPQPGTDTWARAEWHDAIEEADEVVVFASGTAHLLAGLGVTLWLALAEPMTLDALVAVAEHTHGSHPEARDLVTGALADLAERQLVQPPTG